MGNHFTSLLIHNKDRLSQSSFLKLFKSEMKKTDMRYAMRILLNYHTQSNMELIGQQYILKHMYRVVAMFVMMLHNLLRCLKRSA